MLVIPATLREFELYALSLPEGPNFAPNAIIGAWKTRDSRAVGAILSNPDTGLLSTLALRRQTDHRFVRTHSRAELPSQDAAILDVTAALKPDDPPETIPAGVKRRPSLLNPETREVGANFKLLTTTVSHYAAMLAIGETYLALPNPDDNFVSDFQTSNFDARIWELYLLATFREQGVIVRQDHPSPDFLIERAGCKCYVEASPPIRANALSKAIPCRSMRLTITKNA